MFNGVRKYMGYLKFSVALLLLVFLSNCKSSAIDQDFAFNSQEIAFFHTVGEGKISGEVIPELPAADRIYFKNRTVLLVPAGQYANERVKLLFGKDKFTRGFTRLQDADPEYLRCTKQIKMTEEDKFTFSELSDGDYHILVDFHWEEGGLTHQGYLRSFVQIRDGEEQHLIITG